MSDREVEALVEVHIPQLSLPLREALYSVGASNSSECWHVYPGEVFKAGDTIVEFELKWSGKQTPDGDKARTAAVVSPFTGKLLSYEGLGISDHFFSFRPIISAKDLKGDTSEVHDWIERTCEPYSFYKFTVQSVWHALHSDLKTDRNTLINEELEKMKSGLKLTRIL